MARPKKKEDQVRQSATTNLLPDTLEVLDRLSRQMDRSRSYLIEKMTLRGLAAFERDGLLDEPPPKIKPGVHYNQIIDARSVPGGAKPARPAKSLEILESPVDIDQGQPIRKKREKVG